MSFQDSVQSQPDPFAWLSLLPSQQDPMAFLERVTEALQASHSVQQAQAQAFQQTQVSAVQSTPKVQPSLSELLSKVEAAIESQPDFELKTLVSEAEPEVVKKAIQALEEALEEGRANYPMQFLKHAIKGKWKPKI
jgi:tRNA U34 5-carboxymethylaminomethyl modifying GTPase MnmE/TrmE